MEGNGIQPVMNVGGYNDGFGYGGGNFAWFILLFALLGNGGFGWGGNRGIATQSDVYAANDMQDMKANQRQIMTIGNNLGNGIADATFSLSRDINQGVCMLDKSIMQGDFNIEKTITDNRYVLGSAINDGRFATQYGFAEMGRNIDGVRYDGAMNTCKITTNATENTQKILDKLNNMEFNAMKAENENLRMALAKEHNINVNYAQTRDIVGAVRPFPVPTFLVGNPYGNNGCNCGVNYGCQC